MKKDQAMETDSGTNSATVQEQGNQSQSPDAQGKKAESEKTFTQEELNNIVQKRLEQERQKMPSKEQLDKFKAWEQEQKTEAEKQAEKDQQFNQMLNELNLYKNKEKVTKAGVDPKFAEYSVFEVSKLVDEETDFDTALKTWIEKNEQYKQNAEPIKKSTGMRQGSAGKQMDGVEEAFRKRNPNLKF